MGTLQDLPSGKKFTAATWQKKLKQGTHYGDLSSLKDNQEAINAIAKKREGAIRSGSYDSSRRRSDYQEILRTDDTLSGKDKKSVKGILEHWGAKPSVAVSKSSSIKPDTKKAPTKPVRRREPIDLSQDHYSPFNPTPPPANDTPYGAPPKGTNSMGNYFYNSPSSPGASKPSNTYKPPRLSV